MKKIAKKIKNALAILGPGFITGAADDDPSGIATYSQTGAQFGYTQLWTALFSTPFMAVIQEMAGRIGLVTGKGLGRVIRENYSKLILYGSVFLLVVINTVNIGADLGAMASSAQLVFGLPFAAWLLVFTVLTLVLEIFVPYKTYAKFLKYLTLSLFAYFATAFIVSENWPNIFSAAIIPRFAFRKDYLLNIVAILGTTISPYLFFWQADEEVEEEIAHHERRRVERGEVGLITRLTSRMRLDTAVGMIFSNLIMFFIIVTTAATLGAHGMTTVTTADQAAEALRPLAGPLTFILFALGIIGTGLLAVPVLAASASYAISESLNIDVGLYKKFRRAHGFYGAITIATILGLVINFTSIPPFRLLYYTAVLSGIAAPIIMAIVVHAAGNKKILGNYKSSRTTNILGWFITGLMGAMSVALILNLLL